MIQDPDFCEVVREAHKLARSFIDEYWPADDLAEAQGMVLATSPNVPTSPLLANITRFVTDVLESDVVTNIRLPYRGFASWLCLPDGGGYAIAIDRAQMRAWYTQFGVPLDGQTIRSVVHELGHVFLGHAEAAVRRQPEQIMPNGPVPIRLIPSVEDLDEEKAWVFAMTFLGIILGNHSLRSRAGGADTAPVVRA